MPKRRFERVHESCLCGDYEVYRLMRVEEIVGYCIPKGGQFW